MQGSHSSWENIPGVLSSAGKLCTMFPSSHSQTSTTSEVMQSEAERECAARVVLVGVDVTFFAFSSCRRGLFPLLLLDVLPASAYAWHGPQNNIRPTPIPHKSPLFPCEPHFECNIERGPHEVDVRLRHPEGHTRSAGLRDRKTMALR